MVSQQDCEAPVTSQAFDSVDNATNRVVSTNGTETDVQIKPNTSFTVHFLGLCALMDTFCGIRVTSDADIYGYAKRSLKLKFKS